MDNESSKIEITKNPEQGNLKKLRVASLRTLVMEKGLLQTDEINKLKKDNLIKLLQEN